MSEKSHGIKDLKEAVGFGLSLTELGFSLANGIGVDDTLPLMETVKRAGPAIADYKNIIPQAQDLDSEEKIELKAYIESDFDIDADKVEEAIKLGLKIAVDLSGLLTLLKKKEIA